MLPWESERGQIPLELESRAVRVLGTELTDLEEQQVLLATEPPAPLLHL